jgi:tRNA G18 (ribose-2'-O)-methylase SpoU
MRKLSLKELNRVSPEAFKQQPKTPFVLVLDNVRSALNVGSAFRTADSFALEKIYLCGITAQPPHREILKTAIGATDSVKWKYFENTSAAIDDLRKSDFQIIGVEQTNKSTLLQNFTLKPDEKIALIFGNEVSGISDEIIPLLDDCIEVPQYGTKHSLNISVCIGVVVWELFRKWKF